MIPTGITHKNVRATLHGHTFQIINEPDVATLISNLIVGETLRVESLVEFENERFPGVVSVSTFRSIVMRYVWLAVKETPNNYPTVYSGRLNGGENDFNLRRIQ